MKLTKAEREALQAARNFVKRAVSTLEKGLLGAHQSAWVYDLLDWLKDSEKLLDKP